MSDTALRPRSTTEIVDAAFALYRRDFMQYIMVGAIAYSPMIVLALATQGMGDMAKGAVTVVNYIGGMIVASLVFGFVVRMGSQVYLEGRSADVGDTVRKVMPRVPAIIGSSLLMTLLSMLGILLFIFPGIYLFTRMSVATNAVILESASPTFSLKRSMVLTKGRAGAVFLTLLLAYGVYMVLSMAVLMLGASLGETIISVFSMLLGIVCYPVIGLVTMVLYYDLRIRVEGFDVEHMAQSLNDASRNASPMSSVA